MAKRRKPNVLATSMERINAGRFGLYILLMAYTRMMQPLPKMAENTVPKSKACDG